jgi:hypothetical protein
LIQTDNLDGLKKYIQKYKLPLKIEGELIDYSILTPTSIKVFDWFMEEFSMNDMYITMLTSVNIFESKLLSIEQKDHYNQLKCYNEDIDEIYENKQACSFFKSIKFSWGFTEKQIFLPQINEIRDAQWWLKSLTDMLIP